MDQNRRTFLRSLAAVCATGIGSKLKVSSTLVAAGAAGGTAAAAAATTTAATAAATGATAMSLYGTGVRAQVFEVVVRQALMGVPWKEICSGPMQVNAISIEEVEKEVERRKQIPHDSANTESCPCLKCTQARQRAVREKTKQAEQAVDEIPHSEQSPCGCNECYRKIISLRYHHQIIK
jgi:hypothetical protein